MSLLTMSAQLAEGFLITVEIFVLTLLFSLPLMNIPIKKSFC